MRAHAGAEPIAAQFGFFEPSLVYYVDGRVEKCEAPARACEFLQESHDHFLLTTQDQYEHLAAYLPPDVEVLARQTDFPRRVVIVLLGRPIDLASRGEPAP